MCRSIHRLHAVEPPAGQEEIRAAALQYVRKISGYRAPSRANQAAFDAAVDAVAAASSNLLGALQSSRRPAAGRLEIIHRPEEDL